MKKVQTVKPTRDITSKVTTRSEPNAAGSQGKFGSEPRPVDKATHGNKNTGYPKVTDC